MKRGEGEEGVENRGKAEVKGMTVEGNKGRRGEGCWPEEKETDSRVGEEKEEEEEKR